MICTQTEELSVEIRQLGQSSSLNIFFVPTCEVKARSCLWIIAVQKVQRDTKEVSVKKRCYDKPQPEGSREGTQSAKRENEKCFVNILITKLINRAHKLETEDRKN